MLVAFRHACAHLLLHLSEALYLQLPQLGGPPIRVIEYRRIDPIDGSLPLFSEPFLRAVPIWPLAQPSFQIMRRIGFDYSCDRGDRLCVAIGAFGVGGDAGTTGDQSLVSKDFLGGVGNVDFPLGVHSNA